MAGKFDLSEASRGHHPTPLTYHHQVQNIIRFRRTLSLSPNFTVAFNGIE